MVSQVELYTVLSVFHIISILSSCPTTHRHRKSWSLCSDEERQLYIDGFKMLSEQGVTQNFTKCHAHSISSWRGKSEFLPWHREFIYQFESSIRALGGEFECFSLPYWDWSAEPTPKEVAAGNGTLFILNSGIYTRKMHIFIFQLFNSRIGRRFKRQLLERQDMGRRELRSRVQTLSHSGCGLCGETE